MEEFLAVCSTFKVKRSKLSVAYIHTLIRNQATLAFIWCHISSHLMKSNIHFLFICLSSPQLLWAISVSLTDKWAPMFASNSVILFTTGQGALNQAHNCPFFFTGKPGMIKKKERKHSVPEQQIVGTKIRRVDWKSTEVMAELQKAADVIFSVVCHDSLLKAVFLLVRHNIPLPCYSGYFSYK